MKTKKFYSYAHSGNTDVKEPPGEQQLQQFWRSTLETNKAHNKEARWIKEEQIGCTRIQCREWTELITEEVGISYQTNNELELSRVG